MLIQAKKALKEKRYKIAQELYESLLDTSENQALVYLGLSTCAYYLKEYSNAQVHALKALELRSDFYEPHLILAYVYIRQGNLADSEAEVRKALEISPESPDILSFGGGVLLARQKMDEGQKMLQKAREINPDDWMVHYNLGNFYLAENDYGQSLREYVISFGMKRSFSTLQRILTVSIYRHRRIAAIIFPLLFSLLTLTALYLRSIGLLLIATIPMILIGLGMRHKKGLLLAIVSFFIILLFFFTESLAK